MHYGFVATPITLMECDWVRDGVDAYKREHAYKRGKFGFLLANFSYMLEQPQGPFLLPSQVQQVFYTNVESNGT